MVFTYDKIIIHNKIWNNGWKLWSNCKFFVHFSWNMITIPYNSRCYSFYFVNFIIYYHYRLPPESELNSFPSVWFTLSHIRSSNIRLQPDIPKQTKRRKGIVYSSLELGFYSPSPGTTSWCTNHWAMLISEIICLHLIKLF